MHRHAGAARREASDVRDPSSQLWLPVLLNNPSINGSLFRSSPGIESYSRGQRIRFSIMSHVIRRLSCQLAHGPQIALTRRVPHSLPRYLARAPTCFPRAISTTRALQRDEYEEKASKLNQKSLDEHEQEVRVREHQVLRPWHRQDADKPPADEGKGGAPPITKGRLIIRDLVLQASQLTTS